MQHKWNIINIQMRKKKNKMLKEFYKIMLN